MITVDINALPEEIKQKAKEYAKSIEHNYADTREELEEDVQQAWLKGFAFCLEGKVQVNVAYEKVAKLRKELEAQIEKMKCCPNCDFIFRDGNCYYDTECKNKDHWKLRR